MAKGIKALTELAADLARRKAEREAELASKRIANDDRPLVDRDALVNEFAAQHGRYEPGTVVDLDGALGGKRMSIVRVMLNRGGTAVERWIANDRNQLFGEGEQRAIRYCQNLWTRSEGNLAAIDPTADRVDAPLGWAQQEAIVELKRLAERVPTPYWRCYENVCRFDEEAGAAGSRLANNSRSAIDAAKTTVAFTASLIAMWRRL